MFISIIIPTFNRADQLNRTLFSLLELKTDRNLFEIIVVDNGSTDNTKEIVEKYIEQNRNTTIRYIYDAMPGLLTGRHRGAKEAKGEILTFIDDDVQISSTWLDTILEVMSTKPEVALLTGSNLPLYESYPPKWISYFWSKDENGKKCGWLSLMDFGNEEKEIHPNFVWGLNFTIRKNIFELLGGFHPDNIPKAYQHFQGDGETGLTAKALIKGYKAYYHPGVMLYHQVTSDRMTIEYFKKRAFYQGVCDSFATYKNYNVTNETNSSLSVKILHKIKIAKYIFVSKPLSKLKKNTKRLPNEITKLFNELEAERLNGYAFHQKAYKENESVKEWVQKENYFDYKLPS